MSIAEITVGAILSAAFTTLAVYVVERGRRRRRACKELEQIRGEIIHGEHEARVYCEQVGGLIDRLHPVPSYRIPASGVAVLSQLHADGLLTDEERARIADWYVMADQMNRAMDNERILVAHQKANHLVKRELNGNSRAELASAAISAAISRLK